MSGLCLWDFTALGALGLANIDFGLLACDCKPFLPFVGLGSFVASYGTSACSGGDNQLRLLA